MRYRSRILTLFYTPALLATPLTGIKTQVSGEAQLVKENDKAPFSESADMGK
ncbi:hypothetical protein [Algoriphagus marinus]|uniref:hypothetical protein n=1 Tax=Algoriphagus marinus TaxID=1925762 RepID=UPI000B2E5D83|nr:hypothetical protein [Algoriphagus marinus]